jgi:hypothetical protein
MKFLDGIPASILRDVFLQKKNLRDVAKDDEAPMPRPP